ncbi:MAG: YbjN domain-containing protein [Nostocaceae cyanobacterium]|nr:YbjN domain-containing protein [Nostocaceae cyanobacterium]
MSNHNIEKFPFDKELALNNSSNPLIIRTTSLSLTKQNNQIIECRLTFYVNPELYHRIDTEKLFNLKPEVRAPMSGKFLPSGDMQIETTLQPDLLPHLLENASTAEETANYLLHLNQQSEAATIEQSQPPLTTKLLNTENWLCLSVKQQQPNGEVGYNTFWNYVNPSTINHPEATSEQLSEGIVNFFKEWTQANLAEATQNATSEFLEEISSVFKELVDETFSETEEDTTTNQSIFAAIINFFESDEWQFVKIPETSTLHLLFRGENGQWTCYATAREQQQQFVFYSICPINTPENKSLPITEFITRANYGMIMGNFEFDFTDGEIRYKTGIDVEGDRLSFALIKQMVYANVMMMDEYLPGIAAVIDSDVSPADAIRSIEQTDTNAQIEA